MNSYYDDFSWEELHDEPELKCPPLVRSCYECHRKEFECPAEWTKCLICGCTVMKDKCGQCEYCAITPDDWICNECADWGKHDGKQACRSCINEADDNEETEAAAWIATNKNVSTLVLKEFQTSVLTAEM